MNEKIKAYKSILRSLNKNKHIVEGDFSIDIRDRINSRIKLEKISDIFNIEIKNKDSSTEWIGIGEWRSIGFFDGVKRKISWSVNGDQPCNEYLYMICFPTGAYIFGDCYPVDLFREFFDELKAYNPKFIDQENKCLYFTPDNAKNIHDDFGLVYGKYKSRVKDFVNEKRKKELKEELDRLSRD